MCNISVSPLGNTGNYLHKYEDISLSFLCSSLSLNKYAVLQHKTCMQVICRNFISFTLESLLTILVESDVHPFSRLTMYTKRGEGFHFALFVGGGANVRPRIVMGDTWNVKHVDLLETFRWKLCSHLVAETKTDVCYGQTYYVNFITIRICKVDLLYY